MAEFPIIFQLVHFKAGPGTHSLTASCVACHNKKSGIVRYKYVKGELATCCKLTVD